MAWILDLVEVAIEANLVEVAIEANRLGGASPSELLGQPLQATQERGPRDQLLHVDPTSRAGFAD